MPIKNESGQHDRSGAANRPCAAGADAGEAKSPGPGTAGKRKGTAAGRGMGQAGEPGMHHAEDMASKYAIQFFGSG